MKHLIIRQLWRSKIIRHPGFFSRGGGAKVQESSKVTLHLLSLREFLPGFFFMRKDEPEIIFLGKDYI